MTKSLYDEVAEAGAVDALGESAQAAYQDAMPTDFGQEPPTAKVKHYRIEPGHLATLRSLAARLHDKGLPGESQEIMEIVRYAEVLDAFSKPSVREPYVHMTPRSPKEKP